MAKSAVVDFINTKIALGDDGKPEGNTAGIQCTDASLRLIWKCTMNARGNNTNDCLKLCVAP